VLALGSLVISFTTLIGFVVTKLLRGGKNGERVITPVLTWRKSNQSLRNFDERSPVKTPQLKKKEIR
jgi:hypothetical protein